jgi:hypothetical protein
MAGKGKEVASKAQKMASARMLTPSLFAWRLKILRFASYSAHFAVSDCD